MSFGFGVSDVLTVTQLAWRCVRNAKEACGEHDELTREANSLHSVLRQLQLEITKPDSLLNRPDDDRKEELKRLVAGCDEVLRQVDGTLNKYDALQDSTDVLKAKRPRYGTKTWQRIKFGNHEMQDLDRMRQKMAHHTQAIMFFCTLVGMGSQGRMEQFMREEMLELCLGINANLAQKKARTSTNESSILTKYEEDDRAVWKEFRREMVQEGYDSSFIRTNMEHIKAYVKELGDRGALDIEDPGVPQDLSSSALEGPVQWRLAQDIWFKSKVSIMAVGSQQMGPSPSARVLTELSRISKMYGVYIGTLEPQQPASERQTSPDGAKLDSNQSAIARDGSQRTKPPVLSSGTGSRQNHKGWGLKENVVVEPSHAIISRDTPRETNSGIGVQADKISGSPNTMTAAKHTNGLPKLTTVHPKKLGQDDGRSIKYVSWTYRGVNH